MRLASLVPATIPVEIWDENLEPLDAKLAQLGPNDLVGITSKTLVIESAERVASVALAAGVRSVVVGGAHATLMPDDVARWADMVVTGEAYRTWPQLIQDAFNDTLKPRYDDIDWADLSGVATITDRVIAMVDEHRHYWTPMLEITRGCPQLLFLHRRPRQWAAHAVSPDGRGGLGNPTPPAASDSSLPTTTSAWHSAPTRTTSSRCSRR